MRSTTVAGVAAAGPGRGGTVMGKPVSVMQRTTTTSVGQLIGMLQAYPRDLPVEVGLGYRDETETYREVTVTAIGVEWLGDGPDGTVVLVIGETGMLRAS